jgi:glycosyltransferase involved in cell wall biosynthesis
MTATRTINRQSREIEPVPSGASLALNNTGSDGAVEVSVVMPCLNESETLGSCIEKAMMAIATLGSRGEVVVGDNGSTDGSQQLARALGARVVPVQERGYGAALLGAIRAARGQFVVMGDSDDSYDFTQLGVFVGKLREGYDLVMGNRFRGGIRPGAMPLLHRYLGNPLLSWVGRLFFKCPVGDFHCGLRAFRKEAIDRLSLQTQGMEFASEMVVKATLFDLRLAEVPTTLSPDGRSRAPHLRTWRDGWRHLRFLLLYSPRWLFFYPGLLMILLGTVVGGWLLPGPRKIGNVTFDVHTLLFAAMVTLIGFQSINFAAFAKVFAATRGLLPQDQTLNKILRHLTLEAGLLGGTVLVLGGAAMWILALNYWGSTHFSQLDPERELRIVIPGLVFLTLGFQVILSSFFLSVLVMDKR